VRSSLLHALALTAVLGIPTVASPQSGRPDPWKKVPAAPASCFRDDDYDARLIAVSQELIADRKRQEELNAKLMERFNAIDPMERARRMQQWMMKDPQAAAKMIEASANLGTEAGTTQVDVAAVAARLDKSLVAQQAALNAAIDQVLQPVRVKEAALIKTKTKLVGEAQVPAFTTPAAYAEYVAVIGEENAAAEKACAAFFGPKGSMHAWLNEYRTEVVDKQAAFAAASDAATMQQVAIIETPDSRYQSVSAIEAARTFLSQLDKVSHLRRPKATPTISPP
jgi:hypothetical protein